MKKPKKKSELMPARVKRAKKQLKELSHAHVRNRDSTEKGIIAGNCCTCGAWCEGSNFHAGHWEPDSTGGILLRYHPHNMHGQGGYCCNINKNHQQKMGNNYTFFMIEKYGMDEVNKLRRLKQKNPKGDILFYEKMIELYKQGNEQNIIAYIDSF